MPSSDDGEKADGDLFAGRHHGSRIRARRASPSASLHQATSWLVTPNMVKTTTATS